MLTPARSTSGTISLTAHSVIMGQSEHFRSTLATAAAIILSLVVASHVLNPRAASEQTSRAMPAAVAEQAPTWTNPPARVAPGYGSLATAPSDAESRAATPRPASFTFLPAPAMPQKAARTETRQAAKFDPIGVLPRGL